MGHDQTAPGRIAVAGATGYLGQHVLGALHREGWWVRALAREQSRLGNAERFCDEVFVAQATKAPSLVGLFEGVDTAFSSVGVRHFRRHPSYEEVDFQANINLVEAAEAAGVARFAFVSVLDGERLRGISPLVDARERVVDRLRRSSMEAVIVRPTGFFNDMGEVFRMAQRGRAWLIGSGETRINPIHGADLAEVVATALRTEHPERALSAGGPEVFSQREIAELSFRVLGTLPRIAHVPPPLIRGLARLIRPFNKNAAALGLMFAVLGERDAVAKPHGTRRLEDFFRALAGRP